MAYGELGPTHHSIEDLAWTRAIDNLTVLVPADPAQTRAAVRWAVENPGPLYLRVPRFKVPEVTPEDAPLEPGRAITLRDGDDVTIVAIGTMVSRALDAAERLRADGIEARVLNMPFVDPLDEAHAARRGARDARHRHRRGGDRHRRPRRRGREPRRPARSRPRCASSASPASPPPAARASCSTTSASPPTASRRRRPMSSPDHILAIDQGTQRHQGRARRRRAARSSPAARRPSRCSTPAARAGSSRTRRRSGRSVAGRGRRLRRHDPAAVAAVGLSTQRESLLLWDRATGEPLGPMLSWQDQRTVADCARLRDARRRPVRAISGLPLDPMFSATKAPAAGLLDADRAATRRLCLGTVDSWLLCKLGGGHVIEAGNAARTQLLDVRTARLGAGAARAVRRARATCCRTCRLDRPVPDRRGPRARCPTARPSRGHGRLARRAVRPRRLAPGPGQGHLRHRLARSWASATPRRQTQPVCLHDRLGRRRQAALRLRGQHPLHRRDADVAGRAARHHARPRSPTQAADASDGVHLVPAFSGLGAPWWDDEAVGLISGLTLRHPAAAPRPRRAGVDRLPGRGHRRRDRRRTGPIDAARRRRPDRQPRR